MKCDWRIKHQIHRNCENEASYIHVNGSNLCSWCRANQDQVYCLIDCDFTIYWEGSMVDPSLLNNEVSAWPFMRSYGERSIIS